MSTELQAVSLRLLIAFSYFLNYNRNTIMAELLQTERFRKWLNKLRDERAVTAIVARLDRLSYGLLGDVEPVGQGVSELRIHYGPGYRVYFRQTGDTIIVLLCGGDKSSQRRHQNRLVSCTKTGVQQ